MCVTHVKLIINIERERVRGREEREREREREIERERAGLLCHRLLIWYSLH